MVLLVDGVPLEEAPRDMRAFFMQYPSLKEASRGFCALKQQMVGPLGLIYVMQREFAVTHPHDNKISIIGSDDLTTAHLVILRHTGKTNSKNRVLTLRRRKTHLFRARVFFH
jgi:protein N-terminal asparagine amidohydrolase